jgi:hypothetical protein
MIKQWHYGEYIVSRWKLIHKVLDAIRGFDDESKDRTMYVTKIGGLNPCKYVWMLAMTRSYPNVLNIFVLKREHLSAQQFKYMNNKRDFWIHMTMSLTVPI